MSNPFFTFVVVVTLALGAALPASGELEQYRTVRKIKPGDAEALHAIYQRAHPNKIATKTLHDFAELKGYLLEARDQIVGFISYDNVKNIPDARFSENTYGMDSLKPFSRVVDLLVVDPEHRGDGVGTSLIRSLMRGRDQRSVGTQLVAHVDPKDSARIAFFKAQGFDVLGAVEDPSTGEMKMGFSYIPPHTSSTWLEHQGAFQRLGLSPMTTSQHAIRAALAKGAFGKSERAVELMEQAAHVLLDPEKRTAHTLEMLDRLGDVGEVDSQDYRPTFNERLGIPANSSLKETREHWASLSEDYKHFHFGDERRFIERALNDPLYWARNFADSDFDRRRAQAKAAEKLGSGSSPEEIPAPPQPSTRVQQLEEQLEHAHYRDGKRVAHLLTGPPEMHLGWGLTVGAFATGAYFLNTMAEPSLLGVAAGMSSPLLGVCALTYWLAVLAETPLAIKREWLRYRLRAEQQRERRATKSASTGCPGAMGRIARGR